MPDRSSWLFLSLFIFLFTVIGFISSYAESYISALSEKKLEKDKENDVRYTEEFEKLLNRKQKILSSLSFVKVFMGIAYGISAAVMFYEHLAVVFYYLFGRPAESPLALLGCHLLSAACIFFIIGFIFYFLVIVLPNRLGFKKAHSENLTYSVYPIVNFISRLDIIISAPFHGFSSLFFKDESIDDYITEDEILSLVDISEENGKIETAEKEMIENVFDFSDIRAGDLMTHRTSVVAIDIKMSEEEILALIDENEYSRYPVYRDDIDNIIGILNSKKFYSNMISQNKKHISELLYKPYLVPESIHADSLLNEMRKSKNHMAVIVDEYGGTCGIVTMEDLLEKIVGNIYDETDDPASEQEIINLGDGLWKVAGTADLSLLSDELDVTIENEDEDFDTLGGLVFSRLTVIPTDGTLPTVDVCGLHIEVISMNDRRIEWAKVSKLEQKTDEDEE